MQRQREEDCNANSAADPENGHANSASAFHIIHPQQEQLPLSEHGQHEQPKTAHTINRDPWYQVGTLLAVSFNGGYILSYSNLILNTLGWLWGIISMVVLAILSFGANDFLANLHIIDGKRFIRYRDLTSYAFAGGKKMRYLVWILQLLNFILGNMGFLLLAGNALKQIGAATNFSTSMTLQEYIIISGFVCFLFAMIVPSLSKLRMWIGISGVLTATYAVIIIIFCISDGRRHLQNYQLAGSKSQKIFNALNGIAAIIVTHNSGMLPEIQATLKQPVVQNMRKALGFQFSVGLTVYYGVTIIGYWAYGSSVSGYLLNNLSGPAWVKVLANASMFFQTIISQHMFCSAIHETLDTKFCSLKKKEFSFHNILVRLVLRGAFFTMNTFTAAMLPFIGDFVGLLGSLALIPLTFIFPSMIYIKVKGEKLRMTEAIGHYTNIVLFSLLTVATVTASFHSIIDDSRTYHLFANT